MWEPSALCCFTRKAGCLVLGSFELIGAILVWVWGIFTLAAFESGLMPLLCQSAHMTPERCLDQFRPIVDGVVVFFLVVGTVQGLFAILMLYGVTKGKHRYMVPFMIKNAILVFLHIIGASILVSFLCVINFLAVVITAYVNGSMIFMSTYFLLTARAYYYELKRGKVDDEHMLVEN